MTHASGFTNQGEYKPCNLLAGEYPALNASSPLPLAVTLPKALCWGVLPHLASLF